MGWLRKLLGGSEQDQFARRIIRAIRDAGDPRDVAYDADGFRLVCGDHVANLGNSFIDYQKADRAAKPEVVSHVVRAWFSDAQALPEEFEDARHDLMPTVRSLSYFDPVHLALAHGGMGEVSIAYQPFGEQLALGLVYDLPHAMRSIDQEDLDGWGVSFFEAVEVAKENLRSIEVSQYAQVGEGTYLIAVGDSYDATRIVLLEESFSLDVVGEPVAMIPTRDDLVVTGANDADGLRVMVEYSMQQYQSGSRPISLQPFVHRGGEWIPYVPESDHACYGLLRELSVQWRSAEYEEQKEALDAWNERRGIPTFVASYMGMKDEAGEIGSAAVWTQGVHSWLPKTDQIAFVMEGEGGVVGTASWDRFVEAFPGSLSEVADIYPKRFETQDFPDLEALAAVCDGPPAA